MKITKLATVLILLGFTVSCSNTQQNDQAESQTEAVAEEHPADEHPANNEHPAASEEHPAGDAKAITPASEIKITLNNGNKWAADESTFTGMKRLEMTLDNFNEEHSAPAIADYNKLGEALANIDKDIISQCSMQGEDHDQLHVLLAPMLGYVDVIKNGKEIEKIEESVAELRKALAMFFEHFEVK